MVHGDIKVDNILFPYGSQDPSKVCFIDFGEAIPYKEADGSHVPLREVKNFKNRWFASPYVIDNNPLSRRDDVISLVYSLQFMHNRFEPLLQQAPTESEVARFKVEASA
jgi:serine/threonine protein kinase